MKIIKPEITQQCFMTLWPYVSFRYRIKLGIRHYQVYRKATVNKYFLCIVVVSNSFYVGSISKV